MNAAHNRVVLLSIDARLVKAKVCRIGTEFLIIGANIETHRENPSW